jgi:hypothetical protein
MNQSYNQFNGVPRRHQEDGGRGVGVMSGLVLGASAASAALYGGEMYQGRINGKYNTRIDAISSSRAGKMEAAAEPYNTRAKGIDEVADINDNTATSRARRAARPYGQEARGYKNNGNLSMSEHFGRQGAAAGRASLEATAARSASLRGEAAHVRGQGAVAAERAGASGQRAITKMEGMRDSHWINKTMNSKPAQFLGGSGKRKAATIATTAVLGGLLGGAMDDPNS